MHRVVALLTVALLAAACADLETTTDDELATGGADDAPAAAEESSGAGFDDGTWLVGQDVQAGFWRTDGGSGCYWARLADLSGELDAIIANENASGPVVLEISATDEAVESQRCGTWTPLDSSSLEARTAFGDGIWLVGPQIAPGRYRAPGGDGCYWARLSGFGGTLDELVANENASGSAIVDIQEGDAGFQSVRCGEWAPA